MSARQLTAELARALGLPKHTRRAVLTLHHNEPPTLDITLVCLGRSTGGNAEPSDITLNSAAERISTLAFTLQPAPARVEFAKLLKGALLAREALSHLLMTRDPIVYSTALSALDEALGDYYAATGRVDITTIGDKEPRYINVHPEGEL